MVYRTNRGFWKLIVLCKLQRFHFRERLKREENIELLVLSSFFLAPEGLTSNRNVGQICLNIYFLFYSFVYFFIALS